MDTHDKQHLAFLKNSSKRISNLLAAAKALKKRPHHDIAEFFKTNIAGSTVYFYGTRSMGLGHKKCHLNIFLEIDNSFWNSLNEEKIKELISIVSLCIAQDVKIKLEITDSVKLWSDQFSRPTVPVPILRTIYVPEKVQCDITFTNGIGVKIAELIKYMFDLQPEALKLYHFVRIWIHIEGLSFKRYLVALLVIFFMQKIKLMPSFESLLDENLPSLTIDGWNVKYDFTQNLKDFGMEKVGDYQELLISFFEYYKDFEYRNYVICPFLGREILKVDYPNNEELLACYKDVIKTFKTGTSIAVADSINLNFNCSHGIGKKRLVKFQVFCKHAIDLLNEYL